MPEIKAAAARPNDAAEVLLRRFDNGAGWRSEAGDGVIGHREVMRGGGYEALAKQLDALSTVDRTRIERMLDTHATRKLQATRTVSRTYFAKISPAQLDALEQVAQKHGGSVKVDPWLCGAFLAQWVQVSGSRELCAAVADILRPTMIPR